MMMVVMVREENLKQKEGKAVLIRFPTIVPERLLSRYDTTYLSCLSDVPWQHFVYIRLASQLKWIRGRWRQLASWLFVDPRAAAGISASAEETYSFYLRRALYIGSLMALQRSGCVSQYEQILLYSPTTVNIDHNFYPPMHAE